MARTRRDDGDGDGNGADERTPLLLRQAAAAQQQPPPQAEVVNKGKQQHDTQDRAKDKGKAKAAPPSPPPDADEDEDVKLVYSVFGQPGHVYDGTLPPASGLGRGGRGPGLNSRAGAGGAEQSHEAQQEEAQMAAEVQQVEEAIASGLQPKMIAKGSSGSYFARARDAAATDGVRTMAVFKVREEELAQPTQGRVVQRLFITS